MSRSISLSHRSCGVLLHITSLPGGYGIGDLGGSSRRFADFLHEAGQGWWEVLPINPIGPGDSPYSSPSAFAGNPLLIDLDALIDDGLLTPDEVGPPPGPPPGLPPESLPGPSPEAPPATPPGAPTGRVRFPSVIRHREKVLHKAFDRFQRRKRSRASFQNFCDRNEFWLDDYTLYRALKRTEHPGGWMHWPVGIRQRRDSVLRSVGAGLRELIDYERFVQFIFFEQWGRFKRYCNDRGIGLIGDLPMFVNRDSSDVWSRRELFRIDAKGRPKEVSGAPPDAFIPTGQKWGHPLYHWSRHRTTGFDWWTGRFRQAMELFDAVRVDHFLGFDRCWAIPDDAPTAEDGRWTSSPGDELFTRVRESMSHLEVIAEDLGSVTPSAIRLRDQLGFLGMRILQNAFGGGDSYDLPHNYPNRCVAYTGTHDNDTTVGWFRKLPRSTRHPRTHPRTHHPRTRPQKNQSPGGLTARQRVLRYTGTDGRQIHRDLIRLLYLSPADLVIVPMQDVLGLDTRYRMNVPGTPTGNWGWRMTRDALTGSLTTGLRQLADAYGRV